MDLTGAAAELKVTVVDGFVAEGWGNWSPVTRTITLKCGMGSVQRRSVLARLLGHAALGHEVVTPENEAAAAQWGARQLISPARAAATMKAVNWLGIMARELEVMPSDIAAYYESMTDDERLDIRARITMIPCGFPGEP